MGREDIWSRWGIFIEVHDGYPEVNDAVVLVVFQDNPEVDNADLLAVL